MQVGSEIGRTSNQVRCTLDILPYTHRRFLLGEAVIITRSGVSRRQVSDPATFAPDIFEFVYFARPDSVLDGISVYRSRMAMGDALAEEVKKVLSAHNLTVDVVIPVGYFPFVIFFQC
jgi:glutamine phosphoribosylpyrophosphate amidotransferase